MKMICRKKQTDFEFTLNLINGKWKMRIIYELACEGTVRYGAIKKNIDGITHKMLSAQLKELERDDVLTRKEYSQIPPKVEYSLTEKGKSLVALLDSMCSWGKKYRKEESDKKEKGA